MVRTPLVSRYSTGPRSIPSPRKSAEALYRGRMVGVDDLVLASSVMSMRTPSRTWPPGTSARWRRRRPTHGPTCSADPPQSVVTVERFAGPVGGAGVLGLLFTEPGVATDEDRVDGEILQAVIEERLFNRIREELGASYNGGSTSVSFLTEPDEQSQVYVSVAGDPDRLEEIRAVLLREFTNLDTVGPSEEEFARAKAIVAENYKFVSNGDLIAQLFEEATEDGPVLTNAAAAEILDRTDSCSGRPARRSGHRHRSVARGVRHAKPVAAAMLSAFWGCSSVG